MKGKKVSLIHLRLYLHGCKSQMLSQQASLGKKLQLFPLSNRIFRASPHVACLCLKAARHKVCYRPNGSLV